MDPKIPTLPPTWHWIRATYYSALTGDSMKAIYHRRNRGEWVEGKHIQMRGGVLWINLKEIESWLQGTK